MAKANVTIVEAPMGEGKTITATAIAVDDYFSKLYAIQSNVTGRYYEVDPVGLETCILRETGQLIQIPPGWDTFSEARIFANYHLYGIHYVYADPVMMLQHLNTGTVSNGIQIIDEAYIQGDARRAMNALGMIYTWYVQQARKRGMELYILLQHRRFIDWRFRYSAKRTILSTYNEKNHKVRLVIQNLVKGTEKPFSYWSPQYWRYFDTNEVPPIPERALERAAGWAK